MQADTKDSTEKCQTRSGDMGNPSQMSVGIQVGNGGKHIMFRVFLPTKKEAAIEEHVSSEAEIQVLRKALGEANERLEWLEKENTSLRAMMMDYRTRWINECHHVDALRLYGSDGPLGLSQARWSSPSPDRSYGTCLVYSAAAS